MTRDVLRKGFGREDGMVARLEGHDFARWRIGQRRWVSIQHPDDIDHVLHRHRENYPKSPDYEPLRGVLGLSLFTDDDPSWSRHRKMINPKFTKRHVDALLPLMVGTALDFCTALDERPDDSEIEMVGLMTDLTLEVAGHSLFSQSFRGYFGDDTAELITDGLRKGTWLSRIFFLVDPPQWMSRATWKVMHSRRIPTPPPFSRFQRVARVIDGAADKVLRERMENPSDSPDLLNLLLDVADDEGPLTPERTRAEAISFMLTGYETTANAMCWLWYLLASNPDARQRMFDEVDSVLQKRVVTLADVPKLEWTTACLEEAMRIFPPVWMITRQAVADDVIGGQRVEAGETVAIVIEHVHRDPRFWPDPERFDPSRFLPGADRDRPRSSYLPFGGGKRICIGRNFALLEAVMLTATLGQSYVFDLVPGHEVEAETTFTLRPKDGIRMVARRRDR
ncbi:cytochrome P450 [Nocardia nova]|jgi:cytochrome P450|uniref:cytochrome P450 n=1 Tax=Nocardia nova TaxID=37330 RepID=UPI001E5A653D|nr:cytochrome P450 [Nocardia nova]